MRVVRDGDIIEHDDLEKLMAQADSLDSEMLQRVRRGRRHIETEMIRNITALIAAATCAGLIVLIAPGLVREIAAVAMPFGELHTGVKNGRFINRLNEEGPPEAKRDLTIDSKEQADRLRAYCDVHPFASFDQAVKNLYLSLPPWPERSDTQK